MATKAQYEAKLKELAAEEIKPPVRAVEQRVLEGQRLAKVAERDRAELAKNSCWDPTMIDWLPIVADGLSEKEAAWQVAARPAGDPTIIEGAARLEHLRAKLLVDLDYVAKRFDPPGLAANVSHVRDGSGRADLLQDIAELRQLCDKHSGQLAEINADPSVLEMAMELAEQVRAAIAAQGGEKADAKRARDAASTFFEAVYREVRLSGAYVFRDDPKRLADYRDQG